MNEWDRDMIEQDVMNGFTEDDGSEWWHQLDLDNRYREEMTMDARQYLGGSYLKQSDVERPLLETIRAVRVEVVSQEGQPEEKKLVVFFNSKEKGLVLNSTNGDTLFAMFGTWETDAWIGQQVVIYADPDVMFGGKRVGGLRLRAPRTPAPATPAQPRTHVPVRASVATPIPAHEDDFDDGVPF